MILNQTAVYALRAMTVLANLQPGEQLRATELADRTGVPVHYLGKVMRKLVLARLVQARKGHGGGFALNRAPGQIPMTDILAAVGSLPRLDQCAFGWGACNQDDPCGLHGVWSALQDRFRDWAATTALSDVRTGDGDGGGESGTRG